MKTPFIPLVTPPGDESHQAVWCIFRERRLLVKKEENCVTLPLVADPADLGIRSLNTQYLGLLDKRDCYACETRDDVPWGMEFSGLRQIFGRIDEDFFRVALRALHIVDWYRLYQYCSRCGGPLVPRKDVRAKECRECGVVHFPRLSPAVIVLVERGEQVLLARAHRFAENMYSVIAGFVEPGETLEETVQREVKEETGLEVKDIRYFGSQPWPFPDSLMIGFTAQYAGGEIIVEEGEIAHAAWFSADNLPEIPGKISIARSLIDYFIEKHGPKDKS
jgi:NAD+ diphosphatase